MYAYEELLGVTVSTILVIQLRVINKEEKEMAI